MCCGAVVDTIVSHDRHPEEHRFHQGWIRAPCAMPMHIDGGIGTDDLEDIQIINRIQ